MHQENQPAATRQRGSDKILLVVSRSRRIPVDPGEIYWVEALDTGSRVRLRGADSIRDTRSLHELEPVLAPCGFLRVHSNHLVNLDHVREIRRRESGRDWELKLDPPVNRVLPVSRLCLKDLWKAYRA